MSSDLTDIPIVVLLLAEDSATSIAGSLAELLPDNAAEIVRWPLLRTQAAESAALAPILEGLAGYRWIFLPSPTSVEMMSLHLGRLGLAMPTLARVGLTGPGSRATFVRRFGDAGIVTPLRPPYDARNLLAVIRRADPDGLGKTALIAGRGSRERASRWVETLKGMMSKVDEVALFDAVEQDPPAAAVDAVSGWIAAGRRHSWVLGSRTQVDVLSKWLRRESQSAIASAVFDAPFSVPHRGIADHARLAGFRQVGVFDDRPHLAGTLQSGLKLSPSSFEGLADLANERPSDTGKATAASPVDKDGTQAGAKTTSGPSPTSALTTGAPPSSAAKGKGSPTASPVPVPPPPPPPPTPPPPPATVSEPRGKGVSALWPLLLLLLIIGLGIGGWWFMQQQLQRAGQDNARRVAEAETRSKKLEEQIKSILDAQGQLSARSGKLEAKISASAEQQEQLTALYDEIAKKGGGTDTTFAEVEQAVVASAQQLQINGNVRAALIGLENAERRLGSSESAETSIGLRRLISQDIERLKSLPAIDLAGAAGKLDDVIARVEGLPLMSEASIASLNAASTPTAQPSAVTQNQPSGATSAPAGDKPPGGQATPAAGEKPSAFERLYAAAQKYGTSGLSAVREEFGSLVSIRRIDKPDTMLMSPDQRQMARENLRLRLLNARINLLNREQSLFRKDLDLAVVGMQKWFDINSQEVKQTTSTLRALQAQPLTMQYPDLAESLAAIRAAKAASEKRR